MLRLDGKAALITGGAGGIGTALCAAFMQSGARVVMLDLPSCGGAARCGRLNMERPPGTSEVEFLAAKLSPTFATRGRESSKWLIFRGCRCQGRHHRAIGHAGPGTSTAVILGGGWSGKLIFSRCSRMA
jgi:hypothetical protein